jgi:hypothetical protein
MSDAAVVPPIHRLVVYRRRLLRVCVVFLFLLMIYLLVAYVALPAMWRHYEHRPQLADVPKTVQTALGLPGDPLNVGLVGSEVEMIHALVNAGWYPADPTTLHSSLRIAEDVLLRRQYDTAPVSNLYLWGRKQDLAFERPQGSSPKQRHHVRFWKCPGDGNQGRPVWIGAATFDRSVGVSHFTGEITHHIGPDVDQQRDQLIDDLSKEGQLITVFQVTGVGSTLEGRNGGGDWYYSDGEMTVGVISPGNIAHSQPPEHLPNPSAVELKNQAWSWLRPVLAE